MAWFAPDEDFRVVDSIFQHVVDNGAWVPFHWKSEFANALLMSVRRKRTEPEFPAQAFNQIGKLAIQTDLESHALVETSALDMAMKHNLSVYDAIYLEVAVRRRLPLATLDKALARVARAIKIEVVGPLK